MRAWRAAAASLVAGLVLVVLGALVAGLGHVEPPGSTLTRIVGAAVVVATAPYIVRTVRMLRAATSAPEAPHRPGGFAIHVLIELADDLFLPLVLLSLADAEMRWFATVLLLGVGVRHLAEGGLIVRWERRHGRRVLRTGGFLKHERLILAH